MSLKELYNIVVHIDKFKTYDVLDSDNYRLRIKMYYKKNNGKKIVYAIPKEMPSKKYSVVKNTPKVPKQIIEADNSFATQVFLVNLYYQEIELNEICVFQVELNALPSQDVDLFIEVNLDSVTNQEKDSTTTFLTQVNLKLAKFRKQAHEYIPAMLDNCYFGLVSMMVHSYIVDVIFRPIKEKKLKETELMLYGMHEKTEENFHMMKVLKSTTLEEYIKLITRNSDPQRVDLFLKVYNKSLTLNLIKIILYIDKIVKYFTSKQTYPKDNRSEPVDRVLYHLNNIKIEPKSGQHLKEFFMDQDEQASTDHTNLKTEAESNIIQSFSSIELLNSISKYEQIKNYNFCLDSIPENTTIPLEQIITNDLEKKSKLIGMFSAYMIDLLFIIRKSIVSSEEPLFENTLLKNFKEFRFKTKKISNYEQKKTTTIGCLKKKKSSKYDIKTMEKARVDAIAKSRFNLFLYNSNKFSCPGNLPIIFQDAPSQTIKNRDSSDANTDNNLEQRGCHLVVFVHGYQASSNDTRILRNYFEMLLEKYGIFYCAESNDHDTSCSIEILADNQAKEIDILIKHKLVDGINKLSFVCHSMGGLIIRAALPKLQQYKSKMHTVFTYGTPHLGCCKSKSFQVRIGMAFLRKFKRDKSIIEVSLADHNNNYDEALLYKLSSYEGLNWFKHVIFAGSQQDHYCPYYSSQCETIKGKEDKVSHAINQMSNNINSKINPESLIKLAFLFNNLKGVEKMLGRVPHIQILDNPVLMQQIILLYKNYFK